MTTLTTEERAKIRRALIAAGIKTSGMDDAQMTDAYLALEKASEPRKPAPKPAPTKATGNAPEGLQGALAALLAEVGKAQLDESRVLELIQAELADLDRPRPISVTVTTDEAEPVEMPGLQHFMLPEIMGFIEAGEDVAVVGPAGSGKSTMFENIAAGLDLDYYFTGAVLMEHKVMGFIDGNGNYHSTPFRRAWEFGGIHVFEEFDGSGPRALLSANNALAGQWCDFPDKTVKRHPDFVCVMAGNTYGTGADRLYCGRQQLDAATLDRFAFIEFPYDEALERAAARAIWDDADAWVDLVQHTRRKVAEHGLRHIVSPRASIKGARVLKKGRVSVKSATAAYLHKGLPADQIALIQA